MDIENLKLVYWDISEVLHSEDSQLAADDRVKLETAKKGLEDAFASQPAGQPPSAAEQLNYLQLLVMIAEIIRNITG